MTPADLKTWRTNMGWTQAHAAEQLGVTIATYQSWERGRHWTSGKLVEIDRRTELACAALMAGISA